MFHLNNEKKKKYFNNDKDTVGQPYIQNKPSE